jgi:ubiquinol-cytochrome c reductase iron-sulfur subunit
MFLIIVLALSVQTIRADVIDVDIGQLTAGQFLAVNIDGEPVWIVKRTPEILDLINEATPLVRELNHSDSRQPTFIQGPFRSIRKDIFVVVGQCIDGVSEEGTLPMLMHSQSSMRHVFKPVVGFFCAGTGATYDYAGRVFNNYYGRKVPSLKVPEYSFKDSNTLVIHFDD